MQNAETFESVIAAAQAGAEWAWDLLVAPIDPVLRGYLSQQGAEDPDDLAGETWMQVARGIHRFEGDEDGFRSWIFMIGHHRILDDRRRRRRKPANPTRTEMLDVMGDASRSAEGDAVERLADEELGRVLDQLSPAQREVILLRFSAGFGISEIAEIIGKKPGAVQALQRRAFKQLEKILEGSVRSGALAAVTEVT